MPAIHERVSAVMTGGVLCPGCGKLVTPTLMPQPEGETEASQTGERWSFVWRPPSGRVCPECSFPLERYARRLKWIRLLGAGVVLVTLSMLLFVLDMIGGDVGRGVQLVQQIAGGLGVLAVAGGLVGIVVGGRSSGEPGA
jgi:hypothetical protein